MLRHTHTMLLRLKGVNVAADVVETTSLCSLLLLNAGEWRFCVVSCSSCRYYCVKLLEEKRKQIFSFLQFHVTSFILHFFFSFSLCRFFSFTQYLQKTALSVDLMANTLVLCCKVRKVMPLSMHLCIFAFNIYKMRAQTVGLALS